MNPIFRFVLLGLLVSLTACGGDNLPPPTQSKVLASIQVDIPVEVFTGVRSNYSITSSADGYTVTDLNGGSAPRTVSENSRLRFANFTVVMDKNSDTAKIYHLYQATFNRRPDVEGLSFWIGANDRGVPVMEIAKEFVNSSEFKRRYTQTPTADILVDSFYQNVLGRYGDADGKKFWVAQLEVMEAPQIAPVLFGFSDSAENKARVETDINDGIGFLEANVIYPQSLSMTPSKFHVTGDPGVQRIEGQTVDLDQTSSRFHVTWYPRWFNIDVQGVYDFSLQLESDSAAAIRPQRYASGASLAISSLSCSSNGSFTVKRIDYLNGELIFVDALFEVPCGAAGAMQRGSVVWNKFDTSKAQAPSSIPANYWEAAPGVLPANGSYLYLQANPGHNLVRQSPVVLTPANSGLTVSNQNELLSLGAVAGPVRWHLDFQAMLGLGRLVPGYYPGLRRYPFQNPAKGGFELSKFEGGFGLACAANEDAIVIDAVNYVKGRLRSIDLRFAMSCGVQGKLHWVNEETSLVDGLWQPAAGKTPFTGSYVYLQGEQTEYMTQGQSSLSTRANSVLDVGMEHGRINVKVDGNQRWRAYFEGYNSTTTLKPGYYEAPQNAAMDFSGEGRGCGSSGWFIVDDVTYDGAKVKSLDLRFEMRCDPHAEAMQGKIHWEADESFTAPAAAPVPAGLWVPPAGLPDLDTFAYFEGAPGNFISQGKSYLLTAETSRVIAGDYPGWFSLLMLPKDITNSTQWSIQVRTMDAYKRFQKGYYGNLQRVISYNPLYGGVDVGGAGRSCNRGQGWFVVDDVAYQGDKLAMIELRVEYRCNDLGLEISPVNGKIRWTQSSN